MMQNEVACDADENENDGNFQHHDRVVQVGGFLDADDENRGDQTNCDERDEIERSGRMWKR